MIRTMYNLKEQEAENILKCSQIDNIQRVGILTMEQEKQIILRAGRVTRNVMEKEARIVDKEIIEQKREREVLDLIDQKRILDKEIKNNNKKIQELSEESKEIYNRIKEEQIKQAKKEEQIKQTKREEQIKE